MNIEYMQVIHKNIQAQTIVAISVTVIDYLAVSKKIILMFLNLFLLTEFIT